MTKDIRSASEIAAMWGVTSQAVRKLAHYLGFERQGRDWWFDARQVAAMSDRRGKVGRPKAISRNGLDRLDVEDGHKTSKRKSVDSHA